MKNNKPLLTIFIPTYFTIVISLAYARNVVLSQLQLVYFLVFSPNTRASAACESAACAMALNGITATEGIGRKIAHF